MSSSRLFLRHRSGSLLLALSMLACSGKGHEVPDGAVPPEVPDARVPDAALPLPPDAAAPDAAGPTGRWTTGDLHLHTIESNDAQVPLRAVLDAAFARYHLDWITISNHLRVSDRDDQGNAIPTGPVPLSKGLALYEVPAIIALQQAGTYADKVIFSSVEWDMPTHEHFNVGILADAPGTGPALGALNEFEYRFTNRDPAMFDAADVATWGPERHFSTHDDALQAIAWLAQHYPDSSYGLVTHPSRTPGRYTIADLRELNDLAPGIFFALEGMVGNQMEPDRGGYASAYTEANALNRTYGGCDAMIAKVGGVWDALLGEGRRMWSFGDSDFHFKTAGDMFSSGYFPGEYTTNHVWVEGQGMPALLRGLRSGKAFSTTGNLISALDFVVSGATTGSAEMGSELRVAQGARVTITIRFKSDVPSNYETSVGSGNVPGALPVVDHVDLIAGDVGPRAQPGTPGYTEATNPSAHVIARFSAADFTTDANGYHVVTFEVAATRDQYFRLRGTNLGPDVPGETAAGEPLADAKVDLADAHARFDAINDRNYGDLWFYSNPVFVKIR
jgi:hypothetical protein